MSKNSLESESGTTMHSHFVLRLLAFLTACLCFGKVCAQSTDQNYPVTAQAFIVPQANQKLASYFSSNHALTVNLLLKDLTKSSIQVYLKWSMDGPGVRVSSMDGYVPPSFITLQRGMIERLSGLILQRDYFRNGLIEEQGLGGGNPLGTNLPEGFYTFRVQALEAGTGREVSNVGETYFSITTPLPPMINLPFNGSELTVSDAGVGALQKVQIQWMPRHYKQAGNITTYDLKVCKVPEGYEPTEALDACVDPVIDDKANPGTFYPGNTGIGNSIIGAFERGARYAARVTIHEFDINGDEVVFANEGRSEVNWFRYGSPCVSPESFTMNELSPGSVQVRWPAAIGTKSYRILYRREGGNPWTTQVVTGTSATLSDMTAGGLSHGRFEIAVQSECTDLFPGNAQVYTIDSATVAPPSSDPQNPLLILVSTSGIQISTDSLHLVLDSLKIPCASQISTYENCDAGHPVVTPSGTQKLTILSPGDVLSIYDMTVIVVSASGDGVGFSGKGLARLPFAGNVLTPVEFNGVNAYMAQSDGSGGGVRGGCVYEVSGYFRSRGVPGGAISGETAEIVAALSGEDSTGKTSVMITIEKALEVIDSLSVVVAAGKGTVETTELLEDIRKAVVSALEIWAAQIDGQYADGTPEGIRADSVIIALKILNAAILKGTTIHNEDTFKDIIDPFNHPVPPLGTSPTGSPVSELAVVTVADLGRAMQENAGTGYDPLNGGGGAGLQYLGNLNGYPYWTYTDAGGSNFYIIVIIDPDGTKRYAGASETDWRTCGRSPIDGCPGLWKPVTILPGSPDPNAPNPLVRAIANVIPSPVGSNTATITWNGHATFTKYVIKYSAPSGGELQAEMKNVSGRNSGEIQLVGLTEATNYAFSIEAYGADGKLLDTYSNGAFSTITEKSGDVPLAMPQNLRTNITSGSTLVLTWDKDLSHESYELVYRSIGPANANGEEHTIPATTNSITISGLDSTLTYQFTLVARGKNTTGKELVSEPAQGTFKTRYSKPCEDELIVTFLVADDLKSFNLSWLPVKGQTHTRLSYHQVISTQRAPQWRDLGETDKTNITIAGLSINEQYVYKATPVCRDADGSPNGKDVLTGTETEGMVFTTKQKIKRTVNYFCGAPAPGKSKNPIPINNLKVGDFILIGDFPAEVLELDNGSSPYKGKAATLVPYLGMSNFLMEFDHLTVNADYDVLAGSMKSISDPVLRQQLTDKRNNKDASKENNQPVEVKKYDQTVASVSVKTGPDGKPELNEKGQPSVIVTFADGNTKTETITENTTIVGSDGKEVAISKDGTMSPADGKPVTPSPSVPKTDPTKIGDGNLIVKFKASDGQKFGFDGVEGGEGIWGRDNLKLGGTPPGTKTYYVPIKSIQAGVEDYVEFEQTGSGAVKFSLELNDGSSNGTATDITPQGNRIVIKVPYTGNATLFAKDDQNRVVGKLTILSYPMVTKKVVLVSLNNNVIPDASVLQAELNEIFGQGVANINVSTKYFTSTAYKGVINAERTHYKYSADMLAIVNEFKESKTSGYTSDANTAYLFFGNSSTDGLGGVMNRGFQFGFIFNNDSKVIAHELGHGLFALEHTENDNSLGKAEGDLMAPMDMGASASGSAKLYKYQWAQIQNPPGVWGVMESGDDAEYETDGHYSTVYLVCLMLGMDDKLAHELSKYTEQPDTFVHSETDYELNDSWFSPFQQGPTHALTGGFHATEEIITAFLFLYTDKNNKQELGRLLHRYGDSFAHTRLDNLTPKDINSYSDDDKLKIQMELWANQPGESLEEHLNPWLNFINSRVKKYGLNFLTDFDIQKKELDGKTLEEYLVSLFQNHTSDRFSMYGNGTKYLGYRVKPWTFNHLNPDGAIPDFIYVRPKWYFTYVENLASLLSMKYLLNKNYLDMTVFQKMVDFSIINSCSLKGIIDYEIAKKLNKKEIDIPVIYSTDQHLMASIDALVWTNYLNTAKTVLSNTIKYLKSVKGISNLEIKEIKSKYIRVNTSGIFDTIAYKIILK